MKSHKRRFMEFDDPLADFFEMFSKISSTGKFLKNIIGKEKKHEITQVFNGSR